jgi:hypothetical protein
MTALAHSHAHANQRTPARPASATLRPSTPAAALYTFPTLEIA